MLVLKRAGLVYLANPKTATQSIRAALKPFSEGTPKAVIGKHLNMQTFLNRWQEPLTAELGRVPQTFAVMREPLEQLGSWYRYRQRAALKGHENSTAEISFADFIEELLKDNPRPFAHLGRQDRFLGFFDQGAPVNHLFDYARLERLQAFLRERLDAEIILPLRNVSPVIEEDRLTLPTALMARLKTVRANEFALYDRLKATGRIDTPALQPSNSAH